MREYGFIIIKPIKAENLSINKFEIGSWSLGTHAFKLLNQKWLTLEEMAELDDSGVPATWPAA